MSGATTGNDTLDGDTDAPDSIDGLAGDDLIRGNGAGAGGTDRLEGGEGNDTLITSGTGFGVLFGGDGDDSIVAGASGIDTGVGGAGNDTLVGDAGDDYLLGDEVNPAAGSTISGNDVIDGGGGDDLLGGGPGDDTLSPGVVGTFVGRDLVSGGDGNDILALPGRPDDYRIVFHTGSPFIAGFPAGAPIIESVATSGPASGIRAFLDRIESVAFGVTAQQLAGGATPLTVVDFGSLFPGSTNSGIGRPHFSLSDTVPGAFGAQQVAISIAALLANDFDPDGDALTFVALNASATTGINSFRVVTDPTDITNEGYVPADFPGGLLLAFLANPLTAPLSFTYRTQMEANGSSIEIGSTATVTINPGPPPPPPAAVDDALRGTIGGTDFLLASVLLGNDLGPLTFTGLAGMMPLAGAPDVFLLSTIDALSGQRDGFLRVEIDSTDANFSRILYSGFDADFTFTYLAEDASGNSISATVTVTVDNLKPVAANQSVTVTPGVATRIQWADIVNGAGNSDPNGDPLTLASYTFLDPALGTLQGFGPVNQFDPNDFGSIEVTLNPGVTGASIEYGILDVPNLNGAQPDILSIVRATLNFVTAAPTTYRFADLSGTFQEGFAWDFVIERSGPLDAAEVLYTIRPASSGPSADGGDVGGFGVQFQVTFATGQRSAILGGGISDDTLFEPDEGFRVTLDSVGGVGGTSNPGVIDPTAGVFVATILANDLPPTTYSLSSVITTTGEGTVTQLSFPFFITRTGTLDAATVTFSVAAGLTGNAAEATDIVGGFRSYTVTFAAGDVSQPIRLQIENDAFHEPDETFRIILDSATNTGQAVVIDPAAASFEPTILDDDGPAPVFAISVLGPLSLTENTPPAAAVPFTIRVTRESGGPDAATVTFEFGPGDAPGTDNFDLDLALSNLTPTGTGTVSFARGQDSADVLIYALPDPTLEPDESLRVRLTGSSVGSVDGTPLDFTIVNDDTASAFSLAAAGPTEVFEDGAGAQAVTIVFTVSRTGTDLRATSVTYEVGPGLAPGIGAADLVQGFGTGTLSFNQGQGSATVTLQIAADRIVEADESLQVRLTGTSFGTVDATPLLYTVRNDDIPTVFSLSATATTVTEGGDLAVTIARTGPLVGASATVSVFSGTTLPSAGPADFPGTSGTLPAFTVDFVDGQATAQLLIRAAMDAVAEPDESFRVFLEGATAAPGAIIEIDPAAREIAATIRGTAPPAATTYSLSAVSPATGEGTATQLSFPFFITRTGTLDAAAVTFIVAAGLTGDAAEASDIIGGFATYTVDFLADEASALVSLRIANDAVDEPNETFRIILVGATNTGQATLLDPSASVIAATILDDDDLADGRPPMPTFSLSVTGNTETEGDAPGSGGAIVLRIERTGSTEEAATVTYSVGGGALAPPASAGDLIGGFGEFTVDFAAGQAFADVTLRTAPDTAFETDESIEVALVRTTFGVVDGTPAQALILDDDAAPNRPPTDIALDHASVRENLPIGALVGQLSATDPDAGDSLTFGFAPGGNPDGLFSITGNQLRTAAMLDFEAAATRSVTLRVTDPAGNNYDETFAITIGDISESPTNGNDFIIGTPAPDIINALRGNDTVLGVDGNDVLNGGQGADHMEGGAGDDTYHVDNAGDTAIELAGSGNDRVLASVTWTLGAEIERLSLSGTADLNGTGNALANRIEGNAGTNRLDGGEGNDTLYGTAGGDTLIGGNGNDMLSGGLGADSMEGGADHDTYYLDNVGDVIVELAGGGYDRVVSSINHTLGAELERLILSGAADLNGTGNALANRLDGNAGANLLDGGEGNDRLFGLGGNDTLIGGTGADRLDGGLGSDSMEGGEGNDTYVVDDLGDVVVEVAGGGYDRIFASYSYALGGEFERLSLLGAADVNGTGNALANRLEGNAGANLLDGGESNDALHGYAGNDTLMGGTGADQLDGGLGSDSMQGGEGNDTYVVDDLGDVVVEVPGGGYDRIVASFSYALGGEFERLSLSGTADLNGTGNALANRLDGNAGANLLDGGAGGDALYGGAGSDALIGGAGNDLLDGGAEADVLTGGAGNDVFRFVRGQAQGDVVVDFAGNGPATGDRLELRGYGTAAQGASSAQIDAVTWRITSADGLTEEVITFANAAVLHNSDWSFL